MYGEKEREKGERERGWKAGKRENEREKERERLIFKELGHMIVET